MTDALKKALDLVASYDVEESLERVELYLWRIYTGLKDKDYKVSKINQTVFGLARLFCSENPEKRKLQYEFFVAATGIQCTMEYFVDATKGGRTGEFLKTTCEWISSQTLQMYRAIVVFGMHLMCAKGEVESEDRAVLSIIERYKPKEE